MRCDAIAHETTTINMVAIPDAEKASNDLAQSFGGLTSGTRVSSWCLPKVLILLNPLLLVVHVPRLRTSPVQDTCLENFTVRGQII
mmetsp:Transcript_52581/g.104336  ORF Transcript_52581/g.104336 Transcript_52581/m.104336 type:complete len:86 (+) Transcript_52581:70-327(+)